MEHEEVLLGFDARAVRDTPEWAWTPERREKFLLRSDVERPFSTDTMVWPDVFSADASLGAAGWHEGIIQDTWPELAKMIDCLNAGWGDQWKPCRVIAITALRQHENEGWPVYGYIPHEDGTYTPFGYEHVADDIVPRTLDDTWWLLGYDVSDPFLLSGLMNCRYVSDDLRKQWASYMNEYHLFTDLDMAFEFRAICDQEVREHAPFYVYGLYTQPSKGDER